LPLALRALGIMLDGVEIILKSTDPPI